MAMNQFHFDDIPFRIGDDSTPDYYDSENNFDSIFDLSKRYEIQVNIFGKDHTTDELVQSNQTNPLNTLENEMIGEGKFYYVILSQVKIDMDIETQNEAETTEAQEDYSKVPEINTEALQSLIEKIMRGFEPNDQELQELADIEKIVLQAIKEKKFSADDERNNKGKRVEEKQKLFFKAAFKYSENKYFESLTNNSDNKKKKKINKRQLNQREFYEYYFIESALRSMCDLSNFFHPNKKLKGTFKKSQCTLDEKGTAGLKSFNSTYIDLILSSEEFRNDSIEFLENCFIQDYTKTRSQKIQKLVKQIIKVVENAWIDYQYTRPSDTENPQAVSLKEYILTKIRENILNNPKSKLPWSNMELEEAKIVAAQKILKARAMLNFDVNF